MATRSRIGMVMEDGTVKSIYCHWDGYPSNNGAILLEHFTDPDKVKALMELGDISSLAPNLSTDKPHSFEKPVNGVVVAYGRDRGEKDVAARVNDNVDAYKASYLEEFGYLFENGKWSVCDVYGGGAWNDLTMEYISENV